MTNHPAGRRTWLAAAAALIVGGTMMPPARAADAVDALKAFVRDVKSGRAAFTQVAGEGARRKTSSGRFEFARPDRFRFEYAKPYPQLIVADGQKVWIHDADLNQASVRPMAQALGATPAALLTGGALEREFELTAQPAKDGLDWVQAVPRQKDGSFQSMRVGFDGRLPKVVEIVDAFGQRSVLTFDTFEPDVAIGVDRFRFVPPPGTEVLQAP